MRYRRELYLAGTGRCIPAARPLDAAVGAGLVGESHRDLGYESIAIDTDGAAPVDLAVHAARQAVGRSGVDPAAIGLHLHACVWFQGLDCWAPASYVSQQSIGPQAVALTLDQRSAGGLAALHLAAAYLDCGTVDHALLTTGDRFAAPAIDRWNSYTQSIWGDGGTALVLSADGGFARLLASVENADNGLETWDRGTVPFADAPLAEQPVPIERRFDTHASTPEAAGEFERWIALVLRTRDQVLAEAGLELGQITRAVLPFVHRGGGQAELHDLLGLTEEQTLWTDLGRYTGHLGAGDQFAGLDHLREKGELQPGDHVLLFAVGVGFTVAGAVVRITDRV